VEAQDKDYNINVIRLKAPRNELAFGFSTTKDTKIMNTARSSKLAFDWAGHHGQAARMKKGHIEVRDLQPRKRCQRLVALLPEKSQTQSLDGTRQHGHYEQPLIGFNVKKVAKHRGLNSAGYEAADGKKNCFASLLRRRRT